MHQQKEGRWSLISVKAIILDETQGIQEYISKVASKNKLLKEHLKQQIVQRGLRDSLISSGRV